jgi:hypothetical protein
VGIAGDFSTGVRVEIYTQVDLDLQVFSNGTIDNLPSVQPDKIKNG